MSQWDFGMPPSGQAAGRSGEYDQYGDYRDQGRDDDYDDYGGEIYRPITYERDPGESWPPRLALPRRRHRRRRGRRRWLVPALVAAAAASVSAAFVLTSGSPSGPASATRSAAPLQLVQPVLRTPGPAAAMRPPLTATQARQVLAGYTVANNEANAQRSDAVLATVETGSSYAIDTGIYRVQQAENATQYPAFGPARAVYYIPREPAAYPHWFAVQVFNASLASPKKVTGIEYLVFTQAAAGAPWKNAVEPYMLAGSSAPRVALGADGFATAVSSEAASLAVSPARVAQLTAASLDGSGPLPAPPNLADRVDQAFWRAKIPAAAVTDRHAAAAGGQVFGLATTGGGALLFYADAAELTLTSPQREVMHLSIPGFYSSSRARSRAGIGYLEQFATYVPARGGTGLRVVADYSGITASNLSERTRPTPRATRAQAMSLNSAPVGSAAPASRPYGVSTAGWVTVPPSSTAVARAASVSATLT